MVLGIRIGLRIRPDGTPEVTIEPEGPDERPRPSARGRRPRRPADAVFLAAGGNRIEVVGTREHRAELEALVGQQDPRVVEAALVPDGADSHAVAVRVDGRDVGWLPPTAALNYGRALSRVADAGKTAFCRAELSGRGRVTVLLASPDAQDRLLDRRLAGQTKATPAEQPALEPGTETGLGTVRGRRWSEWLPEAERLHLAGDDAVAEALLLEVVEAADAEQDAKGHPGAAAAAYGALAVIYRRRRDRGAEISILERFVARDRLDNNRHAALAAALEKARARGARGRGWRGTHPPTG